MADVGVLVPTSNAGGHLVGIRKGNKLATFAWILLMIGKSERQWTPHCRSSRHLCPVVVLDILCCVLIPPFLLWSCLPLLLSAVWHHHAAVSTSIKEPLPSTVGLSACVFERGVNMEQKECYKPPMTHIHCLPLHEDGWFIWPMQNYTHTHTTSHLWDGCIPRLPAVPAAFDDVFKQLIHSLSSMLFF